MAETYSIKTRTRGTVDLTGVQRAPKGFAVNYPAENECIGLINFGGTQESRYVALDQDGDQINGYTDSWAALCSVVRTYFDALEAVE